MRFCSGIILNIESNVMTEKVGKGEGGGLEEIIQKLLRALKEAGGDGAKDFAKIAQKLKGALD